MIPKVIHYCWFGGNPLPEMAEKCIESWKKFCPEYEIRRWDESNFDVNCCTYVKQAYEAKKWAFVSDYARFKILYDHGGLYFDTDVELIRPIDDLVEKGPFMGVEKYEADGTPMVAPGLGLATRPEAPLYQELMQAYHERAFYDSNGNLNLVTIVAYTTEILKKHGLRNDRQIQRLGDVCIYPPEYFCPKDMLTCELTVTENTRSIHHFDGTWYNEEGQYALALKRKFARMLPCRIGGILATALAKVKYQGVVACVKWILK